MSKESNQMFYLCLGRNKLWHDFEHKPGRKQLLLLTNTNAGKTKSVKTDSMQR